MAVNNRPGLWRGEGRGVNVGPSDAFVSRSIFWPSGGASSCHQIASAEQYALVFIVSASKAAVSKLVTIYLNWRPSWPVRVVFQRTVGYGREDYEEHRFVTKIAAVEKVIEVLAKEVSNFANRFIDIDKRNFEASAHRVRRYVGVQQNDLYCPERDDLIKDHSRSVAGLWVATNLNSLSMLRVIDEACEAAGIPRKKLAEMDLVKAALPATRQCILPPSHLVKPSSLPVI